MRFLRGFLFSTMVPLLLASTARAQHQTSSIEALRTQVGVRLERTPPTSSESSDRGGAEIAKEIQTLVVEMAQQVSAGRIQAATQSLENLFSLIPNSDRAFSYMLPLYPQNAPTIVNALRRAIGQAGHIAMADTNLRMKFLDLIDGRAERHMALATNTRYLEIFGTWTGTVFEWRHLLNDPRTNFETRERIKAFVQKMPAEEREKIARHDRRYQSIEAKTFACPNLFKPTR